MLWNKLPDKNCNRSLRQNGGWVNLQLNMTFSVQHKNQKSVACCIMDQFLKKNRLNFSSSDKRHPSSLEIP